MSLLVILLFELMDGYNPDHKKKKNLVSMHTHKPTTQTQSHTAYLYALIYSIDNSTQNNMRTLGQTASI